MSLSLHLVESIALWAALVGYSAACTFAIISVVFRRKLETVLLTLLAGSTLLHTVAIGARWIRLEHLPVIGPFEMLSANVWGLMVAVSLAYWRMARVRAFAAVVMPIVIMVMAWMLLKSRGDTSAPSTYATVWLYIHIGFIKLFLGCALIALGFAGIILLRSAGIGTERFANMPSDNGLDERCYRFMAAALIFDTLGVVAGAIWAQDAWGRYWSWDTLETWSLVTWLSIGLTLHARASFRTAPRTNAWLIVGVFVIAFFTFFGIPFVSTSLHKGQI
jgi:ABC-type transport system involved in cytochrome c biogenesis permease subunit